MYTVTNDSKNFVTYSNKEEAIEMAYMFQGVVFINYPCGHNLIIWSFND